MTDMTDLPYLLLLFFDKSSLSRGRFLKKTPKNEEKVLDWMGKIFYNNETYGHF